MKRGFRVVAHKGIQLFVTLTVNTGAYLPPTEFIQRRLVDDFTGKANRIAKFLPVLLR